uniref:Retrovirus-related Pol polyprotein from transposon TNT 1-94 n=1 Tax=Tanacetum cinerariifolium TaxID=118510 RepID=A0A6L2NP09_TANCI|nr:retrovirus-related Pol polyprotein from transposon TNT 1-94 [Tanacetum cinerariifolium]
MTKEIWKTLLITHQGNSQIKDNKIELLVQQYEQFVIFEDESIDSAFARFNTIITSLKALDEGYSSKNYVRKFLRALHLKWKVKVMAIEESKDLTSLSLDELIGNLKVYEMIIKKDSEIVKAKVERKSISLKDKKESRDEECSTSDSKDNESRDDKNGKRDRKCFKCGDPNHLIRESPKPPKDKNQRAFVGGSWSDSGEEDDEKVKDETCFVAHASSYFQNSKAYIVLNKHTKKVEESLNVTFDETPPPSKTSPSVDDDLGEEEAIKFIEKKNLENNIVDETLKIDETVNIKDSMNHPLKNVIGNHNQRTLRSQAQNKRTKWVFRNKLDKNGIVSRDKARLVAQGYNQQEGIDYDEIDALVARLESIRILLAYACSLDFKLFKMDVKSAFLNGFINEEVYVTQPLRFIDFEKPDHVYKLKKALYGLRKAPKACIETIVYADSDHAGDYVDRKSTIGICTFVGCCLTSWFSKKQTALAISTTEAEYVSAEKACQQALWMKQALIDYDVRLDDVPIMCENKGAIEFSKNPVQHSRTKHIEIRHHFLRDNVQKGHISIKKVSFVDNITDNIANPKESHLNAMKRIFRYMKGTPSLGLWYPKCSRFDLKGYSDSNYSVAISSAEAEYVAAVGCCANILWMKSQLSDYDIHYKMVPIFCDNTSSIAISNNPVLHSRTKHYDIIYHFIKDHILKGDIELHFIPTDYQLADIFTKPLDEPTFTRLKAELGMLNFD